MDFDFAAARIKHSNWRMQLQRLLAGQAGLDEAQFVSHRHCQLGRWIEGPGKDKWGHMLEMRQLELIHEGLHAQAVRVVGHFKADRKEEARRAFDELAPLTAKIMGLLDKMEKLTMNQASPD